MFFSMYGGARMYVCIMYVLRRMYGVYVRLCMHVCMQEVSCVDIFVLYVHIFFVYVYAYICLYVYAYVRMHVHMPIHMFGWYGEHVCMYARMC